MTGVKMKLPDDIEIREIIDEEFVNSIENNRDEIQKMAKESILRVQKKNTKNYNVKRKPTVSFRRTQFANATENYLKCLGRYGKDLYQYDMNQTSGKGPLCTLASADNMKPWYPEDVDESSEADECRMAIIFLNSPSNI